MTHTDKHGKVDFNICDRTDEQLRIQTKIATDARANFEDMRRRYDNACLEIDKWKTEASKQQAEVSVLLHERNERQAVNDDKETIKRLIAIIENLTTGGSSGCCD